MEKRVEKKMMHIFLYALMYILVFTSCKEDSLTNTFTPQKKTTTRAVPTEWFDWENADWMPTPPNQAPIPTPWVGAGSIASLYGIDIVNDRKVIDGWELLYSTFDSQSPGELINPYFVLYNKYRGLMRIFLYITTEFVTTSSYLQDGLSVVSNHSTSMLNFLGQDMVDASKTQNKYLQIEPAPSDGASPLASNKWYMMQYEIAYDPNLSQIPYNEIQLNWNLSYYDINKFSFGGKQEGELKAIMGSSSQDNNIISQLTNVGEKAGTGIIAGIGESFISKYAVDPKSSEDHKNNTVGLPNSLFSSISKGLSSAVSTAVGGLPGAAFSLLNAVFGWGGSSSQAIPYNYTLSTTITLDGTGTNSGSFPSMPISFWIPGTNMVSTATGYIPLYNNILGVVNFTGTPTIRTYLLTCQDKYGSTTDYYYASQSSDDYSKYLIINPEVLKIADVSIRKQEIVGLYESPTSYVKGNHFEQYLFYEPPINRLGVRFMIEVKPKDGGSPSIIVKTLKLKEIRTTDAGYVGPWRDKSLSPSTPYNDKGMCTICGYEYDSRLGCPELGIPGGVSFYYLIAREPAFICPWCGASIENFEYPRDFVGNYDVEFPNEFLWKWPEDALHYRIHW